MPGQWSCQLTLTSMGHSCMYVLRRNLPPALLAKWLGSFTCHCGNKGWNRHGIRVSTQSWLWRRKFSHGPCWDLNSKPSNHKPGALTNKLSQQQLKYQTLTFSSKQIDSDHSHIAHNSLDSSYLSGQWWGAEWWRQSCCPCRRSGLCTSHAQCWTSVGSTLAFHPDSPLPVSAWTQ